VALGTGCADGSAALWTEGGKLLRKLEGHTDRLGRVAFHPMGLHFVSIAALLLAVCKSPAAVCCMRMQGVGSVHAAVHADRCVLLGTVLLQHCMARCAGRLCQPTLYRLFLCVSLAL
jgi:hypothetical protein